MFKIAASLIKQATLNLSTALASIGKGLRGGPNIKMPTQFSTFGQGGLGNLNKGLSSFNFGGNKSFQFNPNFGTRLQKADQDFFNTTGQRLGINSAYRDIGTQTTLYNNYRSGRGGIAASPGNSFHNYGAAADLQALTGPHANIARQYLAKYNIGTPQSLMKNDAWHVQDLNVSINDLKKMWGR